MSNYLVTFPDGFATLFADRASADSAVSFYPHDPPTIRDLDQEARDREEMLAMLAMLEWPEARGRESCHFCKSDKDEGHIAGCEIEALLKRLGRLP